MQSLMGTQTLHGEARPAGAAAPVARPPTTACKTP